MTNGVVGLNRQKNHSDFLRIFICKIQDMTVKELIKKLQGFDQNLRVVTPGFDESNLEDIETVQWVRVAFHDEQEKFHGGRHKEPETGVNAVKIDWQ